MRRFFLLVLVLTFVIPLGIFSQQVPSSSSLRDYVGLINQSYHPDIVAYFEKIKADLAKEGKTDAVKSIDIFLRGDTGSGFVYSDARGNPYVLTNNHVISQAYSLSITFERQDGSKRRYDNLKIIAADEENDLAILAFAAGDRPSIRGLSFLTRQVEEGEDVYSAGFPGLGTTPLWQFGRGMISNAAARFPKSFDDDTLMGPFIQHTAEIDPGNSGGPLLVVQRNSASGYAVAGINTLKAIRRQAANYAIPINTIQTFVNNALNPKPETYRAALDQRLAKFVEGLGANKAVYPHIAEYLSSSCVGENAEYAMMEMFEKGSSTTKRAFIDKCEDSVVGAMSFAVAWTIENSIRGQGAIKASLKEISGAGEEFTVVFTINNKDHSSKWVWEYGNWRIRSFGTVAAGDKNLVNQKKAKKESAERLRTDSMLHIDAGYACLFDKATAALYVSAEIMRYAGIKLYFAGPDFWAIGFGIGYRFEFPIGNIALMPFIRAGFDYQHDKDFEDFKKTHSVAGFPIAVNGQIGLKVTTSYVPGLYGGVAFQYNFFGIQDKDYDKAMKMALSASVGYAF